MKYNEFANEVHVNSCAHGWWDDERSVGEIISLCHSEVSEALEEYRAGRPNVWFKCDGGLDSLNCRFKGELHNCFKTDDGIGCAWKNSKPEGIAVELADCIIRCFDWFGFMRFDVDALLADAAGGERWMSDMPIYQLDNFGGFISRLHLDLSLAYRCFCNASGTYATALRMAVCCNEIFDWAQREGVDMDAILNLKHEYNKGRSYKHGGKVM